MVRTIALALILALAAGVADAKSCKDQKTGKFVKCPPPAAAPASTGGASHCATGVPCGHTCIAKGKVCHKT